MGPPEFDGALRASCLQVHSAGLWCTMRPRACARPRLLVGADGRGRSTSRRFGGPVTREETAMAKGKDKGKKEEKKKPKDKDKKGPKK